MKLGFGSQDRIMTQTYSGTLKTCQTLIKCNKYIHVVYCGGLHGCTTGGSPTWTGIDMAIDLHVLKY